LTVPQSLAKAHCHDERGQSLVELAIILPALLLLLLGILQIGFLFFTQVGLTNAAREASRNAASIPVTNVAQAAPAAAEYFTRLTDSTSGFLKRNVGGYDPGRLITTPGTGTRVCYFSFTDASAAPAVMARVEVEYSHPLFIPLVGPIIDGWDGVSDGGVSLTAIEDIRVGNTVLASTDIGDSGTPTCSP
jgi:Flp pilus assembly protein TadG